MNAMLTSRDGLQRWTLAPDCKWTRHFDRTTCVIDTLCFLSKYTYVVLYATTIRKIFPVLHTITTVLHIKRIVRSDTPTYVSMYPKK